VGLAPPLFLIKTATFFVAPISFAKQFIAGLFSPQACLGDAFIYNPHPCGGGIFLTFFSVPFPFLYVILCNNGLIDN